MRNIFHEQLALALASNPNIIGIARGIDADMQLMSDYIDGIEKMLEQKSDNMEKKEIVKHLHENIDRTIDILKTNALKRLPTDFDAVIENNISKILPDMHKHVDATNLEELRAIESRLSAHTAHIPRLWADRPKMILNFPQIMWSVVFLNQPVDLK